MKAAAALLAVLLASTPAAGGQVFTMHLDEFAVPCDGGNHAWHLDVSDLEAHGGTLVMDLPAGHGSAALLTDDGGGQWGVIVQGHHTGAGRYTDVDDLNGNNWVHVRSNLVLWGICDEGTQMNLYATMKWRPITP